MTLGQKLKLCRDVYSLKLREVAAETELSISYLSDLEHDRTLPSLDTLQKLAEVYYLNAYKILQGVDRFGI